MMVGFGGSWDGRGQSANCANSSCRSRLSKISQYIFALLLLDTVTTPSVRIFYLNTSVILAPLLSKLIIHVVANVITHHQ